MEPFTHVLAVALKELRELVHRPWQALLLILGPLALMTIFGLGSDTSANPPRAVVVIPPGQDQPRLLRDYQREFDEFLDVAFYTDDEALAREQLRRNTVDAVVILPQSPFETIAGGRQATIEVLYNQIDPLWRWVVPNFVQVMAGEINREIFLQTLGQQQESIGEALRDISVVVDALDLAIGAADQQDIDETRLRVRQAQAASGELDETLAGIGAEGDPLRTAVERLQTGLVEAEQRLDQEADPSDTRSLSERIGLAENRDRVGRLQDALDRLASVPPEVVISPLEVRAQNVARLEPDIMTFYAAGILALLIQHIAVSMGALALVRERLSGVFNLYALAPISNLQLLLGKYLAYAGFTLTIALCVTVALLVLLDVPLLGSPLMLALSLVLLALSSIGLGFTFSLLATSERQAVQFSMLSLLGVVFFSGFTLPLDALRMPAIAVSYMLPATYGIVLIQDVMLRGSSGNTSFMLILAAVAVTLFGVCAALLHWRTRAQ